MNLIWICADTFRNDLAETVDVAADHPDVCARMRAHLDRFWEDAKELKP